METLIIFSIIGQSG